MPLIKSTSKYLTLYEFIFLLIYDDTFNFFNNIPYANGLFGSIYSIYFLKLADIFSINYINYFIILYILTL